jgi:glycerophosphoryl diester phosphodiesterase
MRVCPWTVNDEADMRRLIALGVDAIITDVPDVLAGLVGRAAL